MSAPTSLSATSNWLMAHLRLFRPHGGTQGPGFPDHDFLLGRTRVCSPVPTPGKYMIMSFVGQANADLKAAHTARCAFIASSTAGIMPKKAWIIPAYS